MLPGSIPKLIIDKPKPPPFGNDANTLCLMHFDGTNGATTMKDSAAGASRSWGAVGGAQISTAAAKFGQSLLNGGAGQYVAMVSGASMQNAASAEFTYDFWIYMTGGASTRRGIFGTLNSAGNGGHITIEINANNQPSIIFYSDATTFSTAVAFSQPALSAWHHYAVVRHGNNLQWYHNGVVDGPLYGPLAASFFASTAGTSIGRHGDYNANYFTGYIDEFRWSNIARWTAAFTPPAVPYS